MRTAILVLAGALAATAAEPIQLFNGKDLSGWQMVGPGRFVVEDGMLKTEGGMGLLYYKERPFANQTLRVVFKTGSARANSGVFIRLPEKPADPWYGVHNGYEVQIDAAGDEWHSTGAIYSLSKVTKRNQKPQGEWNTMEIQLRGQTTMISVNGEVVNEFKGDQPVPERKQWYEPIRGPRPDVGYIGLQNHDGRSVVYFKEVSILPIEGIQMLTQGERDRAMSYMHSTRKQYLDALSGLSEAQWNFKETPERWSIAEIAEHIVVTEEGLSASLIGVMKRPSAPAPAKKITDEEVTAMMTNRSQKFQAPEQFKPTGRFKSHDDLISAFKAIRDKNIQYAEVTGDTLRSQYTKFGPNTVDAFQFMLFLPGHCERHLAQIAEVKAGANYPKK